MLIHFFIVSIRNILKYKLQSLVSLLGLAISFACVSLAVYWHYYEVSFDSFHKNVDRIYRVRKIDHNINKISQYTYGDILTPLKNNYQEIEKACAIRRKYVDITNLDSEVLFSEKDVEFSHVTSDIFEMFDFVWEIGSPEVITRQDNKVAISESFARKIKTDSPVGFQFMINKELYEVVAIFKEWPAHSNLKFDIIHVLPEQDEEFIKGAFTYVMFRPNAEPERFVKRIEKDTITHWLGQFPQMLNLWTPLKALHYTYPHDERNVRVADVYLFSGFSILLSMCALLNYLTLFISRIRVRGRDMALRVMCGSSIRQLSGLLMTEYILLLFASLLVSLAFVEFAMKQFMELSQVDVERSIIYTGCGYLLLFILFLSLLLSIVPIFYFRRKVLRVQIEATPIQISNGRFRLTTVCLQLAVSVFFMFCTLLMMKQVYYLLHTDIKVARKHIAIVHSPVGENRIMDILREVPSVREMAPVTGSLFPLEYNARGEAVSWEGKPQNAPSVSYQCLQISQSMADFYALEIKEGIPSFDLKRGEVLINETFAKRMGMERPVGKSVDGKVIKGVVYDFQSQSPTKPIPSICFFPALTVLEQEEVAFKYTGDVSSVRKSVQEAFEREGIVYEFMDCEAEYLKLLEPEQNILKLLGVIFVGSLLMALFGVYALVVQSCEQHRKEIAIRKISGAGVINILSLFFSQYMKQLVVASAVAFPIAYWVIMRWLEQYSLQTSVTMWEFLFVFFSIALLVTFCIGWHVWRAANENPAHVIRKG